jgi:hypothetical protein
LELAFLVDTLIAPCCIKYTKVDNGPVNEKNRDLLYYYGDMEFFSHFFTFLKNVKSVFIEVEFLKPEDPKNFKDRKDFKILTFKNRKMLQKLNISIHDITKSNLEKVYYLKDILEDLGVSKVTYLLIPYYHEKKSVGDKGRFGKF